MKWRLVDAWISLVERSTRSGIKNWSSECGPHNEEEKQLADKESHLEEEEKVVEG